MIRRAHIKNYKSIRDCEIELQPLTVIFGPNSAGKSNFLDALQLLSRLATGKTLKEAFAPPYRGKPLESFTFGPGGISELIEKESASFSIEVDVEISERVARDVNERIRNIRKGPTEEEDSKPSAQVRERVLRYRVEIEILPSSGILRVSDEYLAALTSKGTPTKSRDPFLELKENRLRLRMEGQSHPQYLERYLDHTILSRPHYPPHHPHMVALQAELANCHFFYFEPRERMREANPIKEVRHIGMMGEDLAAFLNTLKSLDERQFKAVEKALHRIIPSVSGIEVSANKFGEVELGLKEGERLVPARVLSEGTLRILGLLALGGAKDPPTVIGFEEPENGIHPRRIALIADLLKTRARSGETQLIVTTHSPILPDQVPNESLFVCRKVDGDTQISPFDSWGPLGRTDGIEHALDDKESRRTPLDAEKTAVSARILRGDFDA